MMMIKMTMIKMMMIILNNCPAYKSSLEGRQGFDVGRDDASGVELGKVAVIMMMMVVAMMIMIMIIITMVMHVAKN